MNNKTDVIATLSLWRVALVLFLFVLTWYLLQMTSTVSPTRIKRSLATFPHEIEEYRLLSSSQATFEVIELLGLDDYIHFAYQDSIGNLVGLYVAYYKAVGVDGGYHSPKNCLPGGGWGIDTIQEVSLNVGIEGEKQSTVSKMIIRNGSQFQVVLYWYQNRGRIIGSEYWEKIYLVWDALWKGRRDGSFVRIMVNSIDGEAGLKDAEERAKRFAELVMTELENYLPGKNYDRN